MGRRKDPKSTISHTLPSSPTHSFSSPIIMGDPQSLLVESFSSSSSSDFEFTISLSPRKSSAANLCPADELFYKGQLLPLHLSPRISMVRTLLASSSTSTSTTSSSARDSTGSSNDSRSSFSSDLLLLPECDSSRPSSVTDQDDQYKRLHPSTSKKPRYFSLSRFSSVFRKEVGTTDRTLDPETEPGSTGHVSSSSVKRMSATAKEVIRKYLRKVKPLYEKLSQNQRQINPQKTVTTSSSHKINLCMKADNTMITHSFSGNLRYPRRRNIVSSCPSSIKSSPTHSGVLSKNKNAGCNDFQDSSSMDELQSAIQGAIAYCKNSLMQEK